MLTDLKFLVAGTARKDFVEELVHIHIHEGRGYAYDGMMSISTKLNVSLTVRPHASSFVKAIQACDDESAIAMHETDGGRLSIRSGKFRAFVKCLDVYKEGLPIPKPEGVDVPITDELLDSIKELAPLMSIDASRPWAQGLRISNNSTYVTNNIILAERWHGSQFPYEIIVPADFVKSIVKINQKPVKVQVTEGSLTFHFEDERWIRTQLIVGGWPTDLEKIFKPVDSTKVLPEDFFAALDQLKPFLDDRGRVFIYPDKLATSDVESEGAAVDIETGIDNVALFHLEQLLLLKPIMTKIDLGTYPSPSPWVGKATRGIIVGQRQ